MRSSCPPPMTSRVGRARAGSAPSFNCRSINVAPTARRRARGGHRVGAARRSCAPLDLYDLTSHDDAADPGRPQNVDEVEVLERRNDLRLGVIVEKRTRDEYAVPDPA